MTSTCERVRAQEGREASPTAAVLDMATGVLFPVIRVIFADGGYQGADVSPSLAQRGAQEPPDRADWFNPVFPLVLVFPLV